MSLARTGEFPRQTLSSIEEVTVGNDNYPVLIMCDREFNDDCRAHLSMGSNHASVQNDLPLHQLLGLVLPSVSTPSSLVAHHNPH